MDRYRCRQGRARQRERRRRESTKVNPMPPRLRLAGEVEDLAYQVSRPYARFVDDLEVPADSVLRRKVLLRENAERDDRKQRVVEIVGDAAGERADRLDLLRVQQLTLELVPLPLHLPEIGYVLYHSD